MLSTAQAAKMFFGTRSNKNACFFAFVILRGCKNSKKKAFTPADRALEVKQFYLIDIETLKI